MAGSSLPSLSGNEKPVTDIGDAFALAPPVRSGVAGPEMAQHREHQRQLVVMGATLAILPPNISTTSRGKFDMATSSVPIRQR